MSRMTTAELRARKGGTKKAPSPLRDMTVVELKAYAEANSVDLGGATKKADILSVLEA